MEKKARLSKGERKKLETLFQDNGFSDFKWIKPENIVVSQWVRMKCTFGCSEFGRNATCPPNVPTVAECEKFFKEYSDAAVFHFEKRVHKPEDRHPWSRKLNIALSKLERQVFLSGYEKAFLLFMDSCCICKECSGERGKCKVPRSARPSPESMAMDVFSTVKHLGYPIEPLMDYNRAMNRYAFLMIA
jgi:predicted metal-binding protein